MRGQTNTGLICLTAWLDGTSPRSREYEWYPLDYLCDRRCTDPEYVLRS